MSCGLFLRSFFGFALQLVPCSLLLAIPFDKGAFTKGRGRAMLLLAGLAVAFSLCYPLNIRWHMEQAQNGKLDDNLFMLLAVVGVTALFMLITRESCVRKFTVLFIVISYAAIQFFLSNMLMDYLPLAKQDMTYNDATLVAYLIVTAVLLPPVALFMRFRMNRYLRTLDGAAHARWELLFLIVVLALFLLLNVLYSALWSRLRDMFQLNYLYFIPISLFLNIVLIFTLYSTINLSVFRAKNAEQATELALIRQNYNHIEDSIQQQKRALHDIRQILRTVSALAEDGTKEDLLKYLREAMEYTSVSDKKYCLNPCVNGLLSYYAGIAEAQGIALSACAACNQLSYSNADLTILLGNALDNAIRAAAEYAASNPEPRPEIRFTADTIRGQFAVQIDNPCLAVSYTSAFSGNRRAEGADWLPAEAFASMRGGGYGLRSMEKIAAKYGGHAWFSFDSNHRQFITRIMLPASEV